MISLDAFMVFLEQTPSLLPCHSYLGSECLAGPVMNLKNLGAKLVDRQE